MNIGELRKALEGMPDDLPVMVPDDMNVNGYSTPDFASIAFDPVGHGWAPCEEPGCDVKFFMIGQRGLM